jgi:cytochrome b involved in lipid metabolism
LHFWAIWGEKIANERYTSEEEAKEAMADWHGWYYQMTGEVNNPKLKEMMRSGQELGTILRHPLDRDKLKQISEEELKQHKSRDECWVAVDGLVLDVSAWLKQHPGGGKILLGAAGTDASDFFHALKHSPSALAVAESMAVGRLSTNPT